jgi:hypothetical protein
MNGSGIIEDQDVAPPSFAMNLLAYGVSALSSKALVWTVTLGGIAIWGYVVLDPTWIKIVTGIAYCLTVMVPVIVRDVKETRR